MKLDATKMKDWEIAEAAAQDMITVYELAEQLDLENMELLPYGHYVGKLDYMAILERLKDRDNGKYVEVTAITLGCVTMPPRFGSSSFTRRISFPLTPSSW